MRDGLRALGFRDAIYNLSVDGIELVAMMAAAADQTQSEVVEAAIKREFKTRNKPKR